MGSQASRRIHRSVVLLGLLLATPVVAFFLVAGAMTADAGPGGWLLIVVAPLTLLGAGLYLLAEGPPDRSPSVRGRT